MILDTGILFAAANPKEKEHPRAREILEMREPKIIPESVITEADYFMATLGVDVELAFLSSLDSFFVVEPVTRADRARACELIARYSDSRIGYLDASMVAVAERLGETTIATLDRRHFGMIKPRHVASFYLLPS